MNYHSKFNILLFVLILCLACLFFVVYDSYYYYESYDVSIIYEVQEGVLGFNVDRDALKFGKVMPGNVGTRFMDISFSEEFDSFVEIKIVGDNSEWVNINPNYFVLESGELKNIKFELEVPSDAKLGEYEGVARVYFKPV